MRKLMWFTLGFAGAEGLCAWLLWDENMLFLAGIMLAVTVLAALGGHKVQQLRIPALILFGCAAGFGWFGAIQQVYLLPVAQHDGTKEQRVITAAQYSEKSMYGTSVDGTIELDGKTYQVRAYLKGEQQVIPGDRLTATFRLRLTTPGGLKESGYYQGKGIFLLASQSGDLEITHSEKEEIRYLPARLARSVREILQTCMPEDAFPFAQALLLGDTSELDYETVTAFSISGIRHMVAVSGLHVAILYGLLVVMTANNRYLSAVVGLPVLLVFAAMAGFTPSVSRAAIMVGLMMLSRVLDRDYDTPTELAFACLVLMVVNPFCVISVSFQMSVASVTGILMFARKIQKKLSVRLGDPKNRLVRWLMGTVGITLSATAFATPLVVYYFGSVSLISVVTNLLTIWVVSAVFYGILLTCGLGAIWLPGGIFVGRLVAWPIRYILSVAKALAALPLAAVYTKSVWVVGWIVLCYGMLLLYLTIRRGKIRYYLSAAVLTLLAAVAISCWLPRLDNCRMTVIDVGQGQSILLQSKGHSFLVDCGGTSDTTTADRVAEILLSQGIRRLDGIALTHYDRDHTGALPYLLTRIKTDHLLLPYPDEDGFADTIRPLTKGEFIRAVNGDTYSLGNGVITVLDCKSGKTDNENSVGILFETEDCGILITGDRNKSGERALLEAVVIPDVDVLIAGHHGSKNSTTNELLDAAKPETIIISVGAGNTYGHPAPEMLERAQQHGCEILRTDLQGTIIYRR